MREIDVLKLICGGIGNKAIASELRLSEKTVKNHITRIFQKLGTESRAAATTVAFKSGLVGLDDVTVACC
jgi:two-component system response regulator DegU